MPELFEASLTGFNVSSAGMGKWKRGGGWG